MKQTVNFTDFRDALRAYDRIENFSYEGARLLFDYLEDYEDQTGEEFELDVIALCCDYSEDTFEEVADNYSIDIQDCFGDGELIKECVRAYLEDHTFVVGVTDTTIIYQVF